MLVAGLLAEGLLSRLALLAVTYNYKQRLQFSLRRATRITRLLRKGSAGGSPDSLVCLPSFVTQGLRA